MKQCELLNAAEEEIAKLVARVSRDDNRISELHRQLADKDEEIASIRTQKEHEVQREDNMKISPCWFCGNPAEARKLANGEWRVFCLDVGCRACGPCLPDRRGAIYAWRGVFHPAKTPLRH
jgi:hypothetical protein